MSRPDDRCPTCGRPPLLWGPNEIIEAMLAFAGRHGRAPTQSDWQKATRWNPSRTAVQYHFGSFAAAVDAAGLTRHMCSGRSEWTRDSIVRAIRAWNREHGRPPTARQWRSPNGSHPSEKVVARRFGRWNLAIAAAGLEPARVVRTGSGKFERLWVSP